MPEEVLVEPVATEQSTEPTEAPVLPTELNAEQETPQVEQVDEVNSEPESEPEVEESVEGKPFSEYKDAFKAHPELRTKVARENAFTDLFPKFSEAKQLREWFPTQEDAERIVEESNNLRTMGETYRSNPNGYMDSLKESDPIAYQKLVSAIPNHLAQSDPELYTAHARTYVNAVLENLYDAGVASGDKDFINQLVAVAQRGLGINLGGYRPQREDPSQGEAAKLRAQLKQRDEQDKETAFQSFKSDVNEDFTARVVAEIDAKLANSTFPQEVKETIKGKIWGSVNSALNNQPATKREIELLYAKAREGRATRSEQIKLIDSLVGRATAQIPSLFKSEAAKWSRVVVTKSKEQIAQKQAIADTTKDAGSGVGGSGAARPAAKSVSNRPRSIEDVLAAAKTGTYSRPSR